MPRGASPKRERQYKKIEQKLEKEGAIQRKGRRGSGPDRKQTAGKVGRDEREPLELRMLFAICYFIRRIYQLVQFLSRLTYKFR
jgi:hypothetical protein